MIISRPNIPDKKNRNGKVQNPKGKHRHLVDDSDLGTLKTSSRRKAGLNLSLLTGGCLAARPFDKHNNTFICLVTAVLNCPF